MTFTDACYQIGTEQRLDLEVDSPVTLKVRITEKAAVAPIKASNELRAKKGRLLLITRTEPTMAES